MLATHRTYKQKGKRSTRLEGERPDLGNWQGRFAEIAVPGKSQVPQETDYNL